MVAHLCNLCRRSDGTDDYGDGEYSLDYADKSARVVLVASEPITGATSDWVMLPKNHALIVTRDSNGWMNVLHAPIYSHAPGPRLELVLNCQKSIPLGSKRESVVPFGAACLPSWASFIALCAAFGSSAASTTALEQPQAPRLVG
jgi:hypothetical protein